jgi:hypothetical protein
MMIGKSGIRSNLRDDLPIGRLVAQSAKRAFNKVVQTQPDGQLELAATYRTASDF